MMERRLARVPSRCDTRHLSQPFQRLFPLRSFVNLVFFVVEERINHKGTKDTKRAQRRIIGCALCEWRVAGNGKFPLTVFVRFQFSDFNFHFFDTTKQQIIIVIPAKAGIPLVTPAKAGV
jgi:hypothetical protein